MQQPAVERLVLPGWFRWGVGLFSVFVVAAIAFAVFEPLQVLPRLRLAPGYAMTDQTGAVVTSETARGSVTLYSFAGPECAAGCDELAETVAAVRGAVGSLDFAGADFRVVTIAVNDEIETDRLAQIAEVHGADGPDWTWLTADAATIDRVVGSSFGRFVAAGDPNAPFEGGYLIVDPGGIVRGDYRYSTLAGDADKLVRHLEILSTELRYGSGAAGFAFDAAHLFLCYP